MRYIPKFFTLCAAMACCAVANAQWSGAPQLAQYPAASASGATFAQAVAGMYVAANPADTAEGGELDELAQFGEFWRMRVSANDGSGENMFQQYYRNALLTSKFAKN